MKHIRRYGLFAFSCALVGLFLCLAVVVIAQGEADSDLDGMPDWYESFFGLNPTNAADAAFNYDSDSLTNAAEFAKYTDPFAGDTDRDGFKDDYDQSPVSRGYLNFGNPKFTTNNSYWYVFPAWLESVSKTDGEWVTNAVPDGDATAWHVPASEYRNRPSRVRLPSPFRMPGVQRPRVPTSVLACVTARVECPFQFLAWAESLMHRASATDLNHSRSPEEKANGSHAESISQFQPRTEYGTVATRSDGKDGTVSLYAVVLFDPSPPFEVCRQYLAN